MEKPTLARGLRCNNERKSASVRLDKSYSTAFRLFSGRRVGSTLERLEGGKRVVFGVYGLGRRRENRARLARIGINSQKQRVGGQPTEIDQATHDRLGTIWNLHIIFTVFDSLGQFAGLRRRRENHIDR